MNKILIMLIILLFCTVSSAFAALEASVNGTVWDNVTGLMWQQGNASTSAQWGEDPKGANACPSQAAGPTSALCYCAELSLDSHADWRLPDRNELLSTVDYAEADPAINTTAFPGTESTFYWTSTTSQKFDGVAQDGAWVINFEHGGTFSDLKTELHKVRCVRGRLYRIDSSAVGPGTITADVAEEGNYGTAVTYTMAPDPGQTIKAIVVDSVPIAPPPGGYVQDQSETYEFPATTAGRHTIDAVFSSFHTITVSNGSGCTIDPVGPTVQVLDGEDQAFTYGANDYFTLDDVLVNGASVIAENPAGYTFTNVIADETIETQCTEETKNTLTVVVTGPGTVTSEPAGITCVADGTGDCSRVYYASESVTLTAVPDPGMILSAWGGACTGTGPCIVTMNRAKKVTAAFKPNIFNLIIGVLSGNGNRSD